MKNFITGISNFLKAFELIGRLKLWSYFIVPILLSFVVGGLFLYLSVHYSTTVGDHIAGIYPWERGKEAFTTISHWIGGFSLFCGITSGLQTFDHGIVLSFYGKCY